MRVNFPTINPYMNTTKVINKQRNRYNHSSACFEKSNISFCGQLFANPYQGIVKRNNGIFFIRHSTKMFRDDVNWPLFGTYLKARYKDTPKVNTYIYGCSYGSEAYTMSILLQSKFQDESKKFFPIQAKDIVKSVIDRDIQSQKKHEIITPTAYNYIKTDLKLPLEEQNKYCKRLISGNKPAVVLTKGVKKPIIFEHANILNDINSIDPKNPSIVMCRNMWPYIKPNVYDRYAKKLYNRLALNSIVVIGNYDYIGDYTKPINKKFSDSLIKAGFLPSTCEVGKHIHSKQLIFEKN